MAKSWVNLSYVRIKVITKDAWLLCLERDNKTNLDYNQIHLFAEPSLQRLKMWRNNTNSNEKKTANRSVSKSHWPERAEEQSSPLFTFILHYAHFNCYVGCSDTKVMSTTEINRVESTAALLFLFSFKTRLKIPFIMTMRKKGRKKEWHKGRKESRKETFIQI